MRIASPRPLRVASPIGIALLYVLATSGAAVAIAAFAAVRWDAAGAPAQRGAFITMAGAFGLGGLASLD